jgi:hypothetical protein
VASTLAIASINTSTPFVRDEPADEQHARPGKLACDRGGLVRNRRRLGQVRRVEAEGDDDALVAEVAQLARVLGKPGDDTTIRLARESTRRRNGR